jgi:hypothetical protein
MTKLVSSELLDLPSLPSLPLSPKRRLGTFLLYFSSLTSARLSKMPKSYSKHQLLPSFYRTQESGLFTVYTGAVAGNAAFIVFLANNVQSTIWKEGTNEFSNGIES